MQATLRTPTLVLLALTALTGCEPEPKNPKIVLGQKSGDCALTFDGMIDKTYVLEKVNADKSTEPDPQTRLKVYKEGDAWKAKYNVSSLSDMYDYDCEIKGEELSCHEPYDKKLPDFCKALIAAEKAECTVESLKKFAPTATDEELEKAIKEANEAADKYRDKPEWQQFVLNNNNLGNKLMGLLYVKVDARKCTPRITDNYMTIYDGKKVEDSNPVGTNHFVESDKTLIWDHCTDSNNLVAMKEAELPKNLEEVGHTLEWPAGSDINFFFIGEDKDREAAEGCTYAYDFWSKWEPAKEGAAAEVTDKTISWHYAAKYADPGSYVVHMIRSKTCEGKKEDLGVSCALVVIK
jgi:hypothetical protein